MEASCRNIVNSGLLGTDAGNEEATGSQKDSLSPPFLPVYLHLSLPLSILLPSLLIFSHP